MQIATLSPPTSTNCGIVADGSTLPLGACQGADQAQLELPLLSLLGLGNTAFGRIANQCELTLLSLLQTLIATL